MGLKIFLGDICSLDVDVIVNAANTSLSRGGGVCGAIFAAAGSSKLLNECRRLAPIKTGEAVMTGGYNLKARHIIHAAGPIYRGGNFNEEKLLYDAYKNSLKLAKENNLKSIAFPLISSGIYGYPMKEASIVALRSIKDFLRDNDMDVTIAVLDQNLVDILKAYE